jgi:hypothetical protein
MRRYTREEEKKRRYDKKILTWEGKGLFMTKEMGLLVYGIRACGNTVPLSTLDSYQILHLGSDIGMKIDS